MHARCACNGPGPATSVAEVKRMRTEAVKHYWFVCMGSNKHVVMKPNVSALRSNGFLRHRENTMPCRGLDSGMARCQERGSCTMS